MDNASGRRVVTGVGADGLSTVVSDATSTARAQRPDGSVVTDLWRVDTVPTPVDADGDPRGQVSPPPPGGLAVKTLTVPPQNAPPRRDGSSDETPGMHRTDTVDVVTVLAGELYAVSERAETLLRAGDTIIVRGTHHAWHNRSAQPATVVSVMVSAVTSSH
ncbi:cupin domain-containing protein [Mycobacterium sp. ZZG]